MLIKHFFLRSENVFVLLLHNSKKGRRKKKRKVEIKIMFINAHTLQELPRRFQIRVKEHNGKTTQKVSPGENSGLGLGPRLSNVLREGNEPPPAPCSEGPGLAPPEW